MQSKLKQERKRRNITIFRNNFSIFDINDKAYFMRKPEQIENDYMTAPAYSEYTKRRKPSTAVTSSASYNLNSKSLASGVTISMTSNNKKLLATQNRDIHIELDVIKRHKRPISETLEKRIQRWNVEIDFKHVVEGKFKHFSIVDVILTS